MCLKAKYSTYTCNHIALTTTPCKDSTCTFKDRVSDGIFTTEASLCPDCQSFHTVNKSTRSQSLPTNLFPNQEPEALKFIDVPTPNRRPEPLKFVDAEYLREEEIIMTPAPTPKTRKPKKARCGVIDARRVVLFWLEQVIAVSFLSWWVLEHMPWDKVVFGLSLGWRYGAQAAALGAVVWIVWKGFQME